MKNLLAIATLAVFGFAGSAHAATVDVTLGNSNNSFALGSSAGFNTSNTVLSSPGNVTLTNNAFLISAPPYSVTNTYVEPSVAVLNGGSYLAVEGTPGNVGHATFTLNTGLNTFGFTWGTIDTYNALLITDSTGHTFAISGTSILGAAGFGVGASGLTGTQTDISFYDPFGTIKTAVFSTPQNSFEVANFFQTNTVPLPPSAVLFLTALLGLGFVAYRRRQRA